LQPVDAVVLRHGRATQTLKLRQHKPDPVAAFAASLQFFQGALVGGACVLSREIALHVRYCRQRPAVLPG
jgi:hypothetical protein